jgi:hypothetical protein
LTLAASYTEVAESRGLPPENSRVRCSASNAVPRWSAQRPELDEFIVSQTFVQFHHNHYGVVGMVRYAGGEVQVNFDHHLTNEFKIVMHSPPALHASDFIL